MRVVHPRVEQVRLNLSRAQASFDHARQQAGLDLESVVGDGTGNPQDVQDAMKLAKEFKLDVRVAPALETPAAPEPETSDPKPDDQ